MTDDKTAEGLPKDAEAAEGPAWLPGDAPPDVYLQRALRVDQAGEFGAKRIYQGQLDVLKDSEQREILEHMAEQEEEHYRQFNEYLAAHHGRPSVLTPLWDVLGYAVGAGSALLGERAAMACTVAVEEAIDEHYEEQIQTLRQMGGCDTLVAAIERFQIEEMEHRDIGLAFEAEYTAAWPVLYTLIHKGAKAAIRVATAI